MGTLSHTLMIPIFQELASYITLFPGSEYTPSLGSITPCLSKNDNAFYTASQYSDGFLSTEVKKKWNDIQIQADKKQDKCLKPHMLFVNGIAVGIVNDKIFEFANKVRDLRRERRIHRDTSVFVNPEQREIYVSCEPGGLRRPLIFHGHDAISRDACFQKIMHIWKYIGFEDASRDLWKELLNNGIVEYIDKLEEINFWIHEDPENNIDTTLLSDKPHPIKFYTHSVVNAILQYSESTCCIPFLNHNPTPRITYQSNMGQAAIGIPMLDVGFRTSASRLLYPQRPLIRTFVEEILRLNEVPSAQNVIVAILPDGYNQEDSVILNKTAVEMGLGWHECYRTYTEEISYPTFGAPTQRFGKPDPWCRGKKSANYDKLGPDGVVEIGSRISENDVVIGKQTIEYSNISSDGTVPDARPKQRDQSIVARRFEHDAVVDAVAFYSLKGRRRVVNVRTVSIRRPEKGDKFSSRHGQKGVVGDVRADIDMPFCNTTGLRPTIIINPQAIPSRMTIAHLIEMFVGKAAAIEGELADGSPHIGWDKEKVENILIKNGYRSDGTHYLIDGITGQMMETTIFMGVQVYQRLKQIVHDKYHARARGPRQLSTRQPSEGRVNDGGLRLGEMERDCISAHGAAWTLQERFLEQSDDYMTVVCAKCNLLAQPPKEDRLALSAIAKNKIGRAND
jgi:DNA-directed RNA polymerase beta subunit